MPKGGRTDPDAAASPFALIVSGARHAAGRTLTAVAQDAGISSAYLHWIERGRYIPLDARARRLATALGVEADALAAAAFLARRARRQEHCR